MKKVFKWAGISVAVLLCIAVLIVLFVSWTVLSSGRLTKLSNTVLKKTVDTCAYVDKVDLTLIGSYPFLGLSLEGLFLADKMEETPGDTLLYVKELVLNVDFKTLCQDKRLIVTKALLKGVQANVYTHTDARSNYDYLLSDTASPQEDSDYPIDILYDALFDHRDLVSAETDSALLLFQLRRLTIRDVRLSYNDRKQGISANADNFDADINCSLSEKAAGLKLKIILKELFAAANTEGLLFNTDVNDIRITAECLLHNIDTSAVVSMNVRVKEGAAALNGFESHIEGIALSLDADSLSLAKNKNFETSSLSAGLRIEKMAALTDSIRTQLEEIALSSEKITRQNEKWMLPDTRFSIQSLEASLLHLDQSTTSVDAENIETTLSCSIEDLMEAMSAELELRGKRFFFQQGGEMPVSLAAQECMLRLDGTLDAGRISIHPSIAVEKLKASLDNEVYLNNWPMSASFFVNADTALGDVRLLSGSHISLNSKRIDLQANARSRNEEEWLADAQIKINDWAIDEAMAMVPQVYQQYMDDFCVHGKLGLSLSADGEFSKNSPRLNKACLCLAVDDLEADYTNTLMLQSNQVNLGLSYPGKTLHEKDLLSADVTLKASSLDMEMNDSTSLAVHLESFSMDASASNLLDSTFTKIKVLADAQVGELCAGMDSTEIHTEDARIQLSVVPINKVLQTRADVGYKTLSFSQGTDFALQTGLSTIEIHSDYNREKEDFLLRINPGFKARFLESRIDVLQEPLYIPDIDVDFNLSRIHINESQMKIADSDLKIRGDLYNIDAFLEKNGLLTGEFFLESEYMDMTQLMPMISGLGVEDAAKAAGQESSLETIPNDTIAVNDSIAPNPFIVPEGVDVKLYTNVKEMEFDKHTFNNVGGDVTIKDGRLVLQELGFSSNAAVMQLTAIYETPLENDLYVGLDFHLLNIQIDELIHLIPSIDSIVPMLTSFDGNADFHLAAETRMDEFYMPKMPTLIGAAAIEGKDLVVMDNDVFKGIKRKLMMGRKTENKIDSLSVEMQVLRNKVDLYPFLVHMGNYQAVIAGRHNINKDMDCRYHISLTDCPLPIRFGVNIGGSLTDIAERPLKHIKLSRCQYKSMYKPQKRNVTDQRVLQMKNTISETLKSNVRPTTTEK